MLTWSDFTEVPNQWDATASDWVYTDVTGVHWRIASRGAGPFNTHIVVFRDLICETGPDKVFKTVNSAIEYISGQIPASPIPLEAMGETWAEVIFEVIGLKPGRYTPAALRSQLYAAREQERLAGMEIYAAKLRQVEETIDSMMIEATGDRLSTLEELDQVCANVWCCAEYRVCNDGTEQHGDECPEQG
jgi:hypothetical protein